MSNWEGGWREDLSLRHETLWKYKLLNCKKHNANDYRSPKVIAVCGDEVHRGQHGQGGKEKEPLKTIRSLFR